MTRSGTHRALLPASPTRTRRYTRSRRDFVYHIQPGDDAYYDICTIHSFCLNHIFRPFCHLIKGYKNGFKVLTPDSAEFEQHVTAVCAQHGRYNLTFKDFEEFTQLRVSLDGQPTGNALERGALTPALANAYWKRIREAGFIDFANIIYYSLLLLQKRPEILSYVSAKFAWILVDEFQDTTDLQVEILFADRRSPAHAVSAGWRSLSVDLSLFGRAARSRGGIRGAYWRPHRHAALGEFPLEPADPCSCQSPLLPRTPHGGCRTG